MAGDLRLLDYRLVMAVEKARHDLLDIMGLVVDASPEHADLIYSRVNRYAHRISDELAEALYDADTETAA